MSDYLVRGIAFNDQVRIFACRTEDTLNHIGKKLNYFPSALDAVGRVLNVGVMMGSMLKLEETVTIKVDGNGPIGKIIVDADAHGHVRAYADNPRCHFEYNDLRLNAKATVGTEGFINVIKDLKLKDPFIGSTPIVSGEIGEDFAYYFTVSEQIPTAVSVGVLVNTENEAVVSGGFIIQLLPNTSEEVISALEKKLSILPSMTELLSSGYTLEDICKNLADDFKLLAKQDVEFRCNCSKEKFERGLISLGKHEIEDILSTDGQADTVCHFCNEHYFFSKEDLEDILNKAK